jgi:hypothetical protein
MKKLSSKQYSFGNKDYWWYNLSSPEKLIDTEPLVVLDLNDKNNDRIGSIPLHMGKWATQIMSASYHFSGERKIVKIHVTRDIGSQEYIMWFGRKEDGLYRVNVEP